jgi:hypothetical protein
VADRTQKAQAQAEELLPHVDFATFVLSLSHSALLHLGEAHHPETGQVEKNLSLARQTIDLLGMLEEKTRGNLTEDEKALLQDTLFRLRMAFVELTNALTRPPQNPPGK